MGLQNRDILLKTYLSLFYLLNLKNYNLITYLYISTIVVIRCLVFIPLGQTMKHFPQSIHLSNRSSACLSRPRLSSNITLRRFISVYFAAVQLAAQLPQAIHFLTSGSILQSLLYFVESNVSRLMAELLTKEYPKSIIVA